MWSEVQERARLERAALRVLTCPRRVCRRHRTCRRAAGRPCPGDARFPTTKAEFEAFKAMVYRCLKRDVAEYDADPAAAAIAQAARRERREQREAEAMKRVGTRLRAGEKAEGILEGLRAGAASMP